MIVSWFFYRHSVWLVSDNLLFRVLQVSIESEVGRTWFFLCRIVIPLELSKSLFLEPSNFSRFWRTMGLWMFHRVIFEMLYYIMYSRVRRVDRRFNTCILKVISINSRECKLLKSWTISLFWTLQYRVGVFPIQTYLVRDF